MPSKPSRPPGSAHGRGTTTPRSLAEGSRAEMLATLLARNSRFLTVRSCGTTKLALPSSKEDNLTVLSREPSALAHRDLCTGSASKRKLKSTLPDKESHSTTRSANNSSLVEMPFAVLARGPEGLTVTQEAAKTCESSRQARRQPTRVVDLSQPGFLRLEQVLALYPISRAAFYAGIAAGHLPKPVSLGARSVGWRTEDIRALIANPPTFVRG